MEPVPGMASVTGERARSQASAICETVAPCRAATLARRASLRSVWPLPMGPKGTKAMPLAAQASRTAASSRLAIWKLILHGRDRGDGARLGEMVGIDVTETEVADQALLAQRGERLEAFGERFAVRRRHHADAQVHQVKAVQAQRLEVRLDQRTQVAQRQPGKDRLDRRPALPWWRSRGRTDRDRGPRG